MKEMECKSKQTDTGVKRSLYHSSLLLCFMLSLGICAAVLPNIPFKENDTDSPRGDLTYVITRSCLTVVMILFEIFAWYVVRKRDSFHKNQEVFWPMRCRHCAHAVGLLPQLTDNDEDGQAEQENIISPLSSSPDRSESILSVKYINCTTNHTCLCWTPSTFLARFPGSTLPYQLLLTSCAS